MKISGGLVLVLGILLTAFALIYETSVPNTFLDDNQSRTMNIGLMQDQQNILMLGLGMVISGLILIIGGSIVERLESITISNRNLLLKELGKEKIKSEIQDDTVICSKCQKPNPPDFDKCRFCGNELIT